VLRDRFSGTAARQEFFELFHEQRAKTPEAVLRGRKERDRARRPPSGRTHGGTASRPTSRQGSARTMYLKRCQEPLELVSIAVRDVTTPGRSFEVAVSFLLLLWSGLRRLTTLATILRSGGRGRVG